MNNVKNNSRVNHRQHNVSQVYLRNFSPDLNHYILNYDRMNKKERRNTKRKMQIHFYNINKYEYDFERIKILAYQKRYFDLETDDEIQRIERKAKVLREIILNGSENLLYEGNNQQNLFEIATCFASKAISFRKMINDYYPNYIKNRDDLGLKTKRIIQQKEEFPQFLQSLALSKNRDETLLESFLNDYCQLFPEFDREILKDKIQKGRKNNSNEADRVNITLEALKKFKMLFNFDFPILIQNKSSTPFITGDNSVIPIKINLYDSSVKNVYFFFPISPQFAIYFFKEKIKDSEFDRILSDDYTVLKLNYNILKTSKNYLFANQRRVLELTNKFC